MTFLSEYCCRNTQGYNIVPTESNNVCARNTKQTLELLRATDKLLKSWHEQYCCGAAGGARRQMRFVRSGCCQLAHFLTEFSKLFGFCGFRRHTFFTGYEPKYEFNDSQKLLMRYGQATPILLGGNLSRTVMSSSRQALPSVPSDQFYDTLEITNLPAVHIESASRGEPNADALYGGYENIVLRMESQELSIRNRIFEEMARSQLEAMERETHVDRYSFKISNSKIAVREYQRQARDAVNQAVRESSEKCEIVMMQEFSRYSKSIWRTNGSKWKKRGTGDWVRSTRSSA